MWQICSCNYRDKFPARWVFRCVLSMALHRSQPWWPCPSGCHWGWAAERKAPRTPPGLQSESSAPLTAPFWACWACTETLQCLWQGMAAVQCFSCFMLSKINNLGQIYSFEYFSFEYFSYLCWCRSWFLFFFSWGKKVWIWGEPHKLLFPLEGKRYRKRCRKIMSLCFHD